MTLAKGPADAVWLEYFRQHQPDALAVCNAVLQLQKERKHEHLIALIEAALIEGQSQPWMYTVLAIALENAGRPKAEIERVLLSGADFSAVNVANVLYSAAFLTRYGLSDRALQLYRQATDIDPTRVEAYVLGLSLAVKSHDVAGVEWGVTGILTHAWGRDFETQQKDAEQAAVDMEAYLRKSGRTEEAEKLMAAVAEARQRDLIVELTWSGDADLDLLVEEPAGSICYFDAPRTIGGGVFVHDGYGPHQKDTYEKYVCPRGMVGEYHVTVRHMRGDVVGKRAVLKITRYQGTPDEKVETHVLTLGAQDRVVKLSLNKGRLKEPTTVPVEQVSEAPRPQGLNWRQLFASWSRESGKTGRDRVEFEESRGRARPPVGYQPIITVIPEGVTNTAMAVISADRRYVRLSLSPTFSALTDVFTFSFFNSGGAAGAANPAGGAGAGAAGGVAGGAAGANGQQP